VHRSKSGPLKALVAFVTALVYSLQNSSLFRMVTLTNSPPMRGSRTPLENAGLDRFFERQFHVEAVRAYKPTPAVYHMVARELGVPIAACCMVAALATTAKISRCIRDLLA